MTTPTMADKELVARRGASTDGRAAQAAAPPTTVTEHGVSFATALDLGAEISGEQARPEGFEAEAARRWTEGYKNVLLESGNKYVQQRDEEELSGRSAELGRITSGTYVSYDIVSISPIQFFGGPPFGPHKIVNSGRLMLLQALQWVNPRVDIPNGFIVPATTQLSGRRLRVRFDQINLTRGTSGPNYQITIPALPVPAPSFILFQLYVPAPVVSDAELFEVNVTSDIVGMGQPFAAFATWHQDVDPDRPWLAPAPPNFPPSVPAQWLHGVPMRYMVYSQ